MTLNEDKWHLLASAYKSEDVWARARQKISGNMWNKITNTDKFW